MRKRPLLGCLILSGYAGVAYELLWVRQLTLVFGSTTGSFSTVLGVFFGGLALGSFLASRFLGRVKRPALAYGLVEVVTAVGAVFLTLLLPHLSEVVAYLAPEAGWRLLGLRLGFTALILLPVSTLMGMTLPLACRALLTSDGETGRGTALIYGINTLGAFLGAYVTTYHLLGLLGVRATSFVTVGLNALAAGIAILDDLRQPVRVEAKAAPVRARDNGTAKAGLASAVPLPLVLTLLSGFSFIALEVVWSRIASIMLGGSVYGVGAVLIAVLLGIALGSALASWIFRSKAELNLAFAVTQTVQLALLVGTFSGLPVIGYQLAALTENRGGIDPVHTQLLGVVLILLIPCATAGASLPLLVRMTTGKAAEAGGVLGRLYAFNTVGSILGSVLTGLWILPQFGSDAAAFLGLFTIAVTVLLAAAGSTRRRIVLALAAFCVLGAMSFDGLELERMALLRQTEGRSFAAVNTMASGELSHGVYYSEGESASVRVNSSSQGFGLTLNGLGQGGRNFLPPHYIFESLLVGVVPLLHAPAPKNALVVGLGAGVTVSTLADLGVPRIKVVELEPKVLTAVDRMFEDAVSPLKRPGVEVELGDARYTMLLNGKEGAGKERFDVIASMPAHPWVAAPIFTREFFQLARRNLSPEGVFSTWFGRGQMDDTALRSLLQAFTDSFDHYFVYYVPEVGAFYLVGSPGKLFIDQARLRELQSLDLLSEHLQLRDPWFFPGRVFATSDETTPKPRFPLVNTDDSAMIELMAPLRAKSPANGAVLTSHFATPFPAARVVQADDPKAYLTAALAARIEALPQVELTAAPTVETAQVDAWIKGLKAEGTLTTDDAAFFTGRLALIRGQIAAAQQAFAQVEAGPNRARARIELARMASPVPEQQADTLSALPYAPEVAFALAEIDPRLVPSYVAKAGSAPADATDDDWLVRAFARAPGPGDAERLKERVIKNLREHSRPLGLIRLAQSVAERLGDVSTALLLKDAENGRRGVISAQYTERGNSAYRKKQYADAARAFEVAIATMPGNFEPLKKLYHSYRKLGDARGIARTKERFALLGRNQAWITALDRFLDRTDQVAEDVAEGPIMSSNTVD